MPIQKRYFSIAPVNDNPTNVVDNATFKISQGFSHKQGNPTIRFSIPASENLLEVNSLRLVGQYQVKTGNDNIVLVDKTNLDVNNGATLARATSANMPNFGGVHNVIDKVIIQSKKSNVELSNTPNYSMMASLNEAYRNNASDYDYGGEGNQSLAQGYNATNSNRRYNLTASQKANADGGLGLNSVNNKQLGQHFSLKLDVDMLNGSNLHLGQGFLNGLLITLHLAPDSAFFHQRFREIPANQATAGLDNVMYVLKNLKLEGRYIQPDQQDIKNYAVQKVMNGKLNVLNDIHSDDNSFQYTPQLNMVKSVINLFLDNDQTNNKALQQNNFKMPLGLKEVEQSKDNLRYPMDYPIKVVPNVDSTPASGAALRLSSLADVNGIERKSDLVGDCEVRHHFERAVSGRSNPKNVNNITELNNSLIEDYKESTGSATDAEGSNMHPLMVGVGCDYSYGVNNVLMYQNRDYSAQIKSGVQTGLPKYPSMSNNKSELVQTYLSHTSVLDTQKLVKQM